MGSDSRTDLGGSNEPTQSADETSKRAVRSSATRYLVWLATLPLAWFLFLQARATWCNYWLLKDGQQGVAVITKKHWGGHGRLVYSYVVDGKEYAGASSPDWRQGTSGKVKPGKNSEVYYSASHPWLSLLYKPDAVVEGLPVLIGATILEFGFVMAAINRESKWAVVVNGGKESKAS